MFKSPRRNGRNKGFKIKHVIQVSMLLGVSIWLLYQIHHSDDKKPSVTTKISHELDNDTIENVVVKLGRKDLRPKVKGTKPDDEQKIASVEVRESQGHEEVGENERVDSKEDVEEIKEHENENEKDDDDEEEEEKGNEQTGKVEMKESDDGKKRDEQNQVVGMEDTEKQMSPNLKDGKVSIPSEDVADGEDENDKMMNNGENESGDDMRSSSKQPSVDDNEHDSKIQTEEQIDSAPDTYPNGTDRAIYLLTTGNEKSMEGDGESEAQSKTLESIQGEAEQKGDLSIQEEEKDALTDLETLPGNNGTGGGSIALENAATD
ncbi:hypothetical protein HanHA300_Chr14g0528981 [Helianthus annuus]|nr:hypothetical protein HanHA300_Chr14g0528981 [Helianthus annuus]KAJ0469189.1 hypothetical protein HanIR_Chr14g0705201 [Helianthus annuus]KAJ0840845.1 hypothetical protein HanPSC8_Chr14g0623661 [Helianthus annuus]